MPGKKAYHTVLLFVCDQWQEKERKNEVDERITNNRKERERETVLSECEETDSNAKDGQQSIKIGAMRQVV